MALPTELGNAIAATLEAQQSANPRHSPAFTARANQASPQEMAGTRQMPPTLLSGLPA